MNNNEEIEEKPIKEEISLEDLIQQTEQKILDNKYYEDCEVEYKNLLVKVRIKPISQSKFVKISKNFNSRSTEFTSQILQECIINKKTDENFTLQQINDIFTGGLALVLTVKCLEVSGIDFNQEQFDRKRNF